MGVSVGDTQRLESAVICTHELYIYFSVVKYLPSWFSHFFEVREVVLDPHVNLFQRHPPALPTVDSKLDHGHVGVWWPL